MRLLGDVRLIESVIFSLPTISTRARLLALDRSTVKWGTMLFYFTKVLFEAITDKRARVKFSCSTVIASMSTLSADVTALNLNHLALV